MDAQALSDTPVFVRAAVPGNAELVLFPGWRVPVWVVVISSPDPGVQVAFALVAGGNPPESPCTVGEFNTAIRGAKEPVGPGLPRPRSKVYEAIDGERAYQEARWHEGTTPSCGKHTATEFILFMEHYLEGARKLASTTAEGNTEVLDFVRKVTALGVACMEENGAPRREGY